MKNLIKLTDENKSILLPEILEIIRITMEEEEYRFAQKIFSIDSCLDQRTVYLYRQSEKNIALVGFVEDLEENCWLSFFAVLPCYRNGGLGSKLLEYLLSDVKARGFKKIFVQTYDTKIYESAVFLYRKNGFVDAGYMEHFYDNKKILYLYKNL